MTKYILTAIPFFLIACSSPKKIASKTSDTQASSGDTRTYTVESLDENTYLLTEPASDTSYGYSKQNPVKTGGSKEHIGPLNERRFLNALLGPAGESIGYFRAGSCCGFKTPNGIIDNMGLLDIYRVWWQGSKDTVSIYINMYDKGDLYIPVGFTARK